MSGQPISQFGLVRLFKDPTPDGVINGRILLLALNVLPATTLTEPEKEGVVRILTMIAHKMASVWNHKERYIKEQEKLIADLPNQPINPNLSSNIVLSQELLCEFDEFLVQIKSALDYLVKVPVPVFGKKIWNLHTFGAKGEDVVKVLRHNLPVQYKQSAKGFEQVVIDQHRHWLQVVITMRDRLNHFIEEGISPQHFAVFKTGDKITVPMFTKEQTVAQLMEVVWANFLGLAEDFIAMSLAFKTKDGFFFFRNQRPAHDSPTSPWIITTTAEKDRLVVKPGWAKME